MIQRALMLGGASVCALLFSNVAWAADQQAAAAPTTSADAASEAPAASNDIVVTGSRITASGFNAPTPTTVLSGDMIQRSAQPNVFTTLTQLPALQGSTGTVNFTANGNTSVGDNGLSALNLRGLGTIRTLTLLDGQRVVPSYITGIVDVSQFPQLLIKRVDVVTGGASASWGSDAVAGVVNFVTDTRFKGFKANVQGGVSTYGDDGSILAQFAAGQSFLSDRLHVEVSGEYYKNDGIPGGNVDGTMPNGRPTNYRSNNTSYSLAGTPAGLPQNYYYPYNAQDISYGRYGLITAGPLQGTAFDANGNVVAYQYGGNGTPLRGATPGVSGCVSTICQGGEQSAYISATTTIDDPMRRIVGYGRIGYDITPDVEIYGTVNIADVKISNTAIAYPRRANQTISCSNPFLPNSVTTACANAGITSFLFGTTNSNMPNKILIRDQRTQKRFVGGIDGSFDLLGKAIKFDGHFEHGENRINIDIDNMILLPHYNAAVAATRNGSGQIVCSSAAAVAQGCLPINVFGGTLLTAAQYGYLTGARGPHQTTNFTEDAASLSFNATPFANWAGDVAVAFGGEWRRERYASVGDPYGNGVTATSPNSAAYPADPTLSTNGNNWFAGNYHNGSGRFEVKEAFLELGVPLINGSGVGKIALNLAGRIADYTSAGVATTWKVGATWETPLLGLRLRGVLSRDIRAPNLSELYAAPLTSTIIVTNRTTGGAVQVLSNTVGNTALKPEVSYNQEAGFVYRPQFLPNLVVSLDYFHIKVGGAISTLSAQQIIDLCYNGNTATCGAFSLNGTIGTANSPYVTVQPFNLASLETSGLDFEASYRIDLGNAGKIDLHALATHMLDYTANSGIAGQIIQQYAGMNSADTPYWKFNLTQTWMHGPASLFLAERIVSAGKINPNFITCTSNCPAPTVQNPTTNFNNIPGAVYLDIGGSYNITKWLQVFGRVDNVTNHRAPPFGSSTIYDVIRRAFRFGVRITG